MKAEEIKLIDLNKEEIGLVWASFFQSQKSIFLHNAEIAFIDFHKSLKLVDSSQYGMSFEVSGVKFVVVLVPEYITLYIENVKKNLNIQDSLPLTPDALLITMAENFISFLRDLSIYSISSESTVDIHPLVFGIPDIHLKNCYMVTLSSAQSPSFGKIYIENYDLLTRNPLDSLFESSNKLETKLKAFDEDISDLVESLSSETKVEVDPEQKGLFYSVKSKRYLTGATLSSISTKFNSFLKVLCEEIKTTAQIEDLLSSEVVSNYEEEGQIITEDPLHILCQCSEGSFYLEITNFATYVVNHLCGGDYVETPSTNYSVTEKILVTDFFSNVLTRINSFWPDISFSHCTQMINKVVVEKSLKTTCLIENSKNKFQISFIFPIPEFIEAFKYKRTDDTTVADPSLIKNIKVPLLVRYEDQPIIPAGVLQHFQPNIFIPLNSKRVVVVEKETFI